MQHAVTHNNGNPALSELPRKLADYLNKEISVEEITTCTKKSKNIKSVSRDLISNEMLKSLGTQMMLLLQKLFNSSSQEGIPLEHKKGDRQIPDNYRAYITVVSLFSQLFFSIQGGGLPLM